MLLSRLRASAVPVGLALSAATAATASAQRRVHSEEAPPSVAAKRTVHAKPSMIVRDPDDFARKWKKFCTDGLDKLIVIADFDQTLTPQFKPTGEHANSSHSVLMSSQFVDRDVAAAETELFKKYFPIEMSPTMTQDEKLPYMVEWWTSAHNVLVQSKLCKQQIRDAVTHGEMLFRPGFSEIFRVLAQENVPTLVFSAGLYDVIHEVLHQQFQKAGFETTPANVHVVSNMMQFDKHGVITGFQGSLIHCFNKNASVLLDTPFYRQCQMQQRRNILLLGDSRGDINMSKGLDVTEDEIIRVGFLNVHVDESLDDYLALYDVVLTNDASLRPVELLIHQIHHSGNSLTVLHLVTRAVSHQGLCRGAVGVGETSGRQSDRQETASPRAARLLFSRGVMTVSGVRAAATVSLTTLDPSTPSSSSPKKPSHQMNPTPPQENQATNKPLPSFQPVAASQRPRIMSGASPPSSSAQSAGDIIGDYALGETIGKGTFGKVKLGLHLLTGEKVAVKILEKKRIVEVADVERVAREIQILKRNRHVNVIQLFEVIDSPERIFLIMEFVDGGEMFEYIVSHHRIREPEAVVLFQQIVDGLDYLHANEVTHRDLKPENLLLQSCPGMPTGVLVKIVDFGLSNTHDAGRLLKTACGSPCYAAPEMIQGKLYKGPLADVWSLGVVLFAMVCGYLPFEDGNTNLLYKKILSADYKTPPFLSHAVQDLIRRIFETNPEKRFTTEMIRLHPWFQSSRTPVPRSVAMATSYDDPRLRHHILGQLATVGLDPSAIEDALTHKVHNHLTAAFYLLYNKLLRVMKDHAVPSSSAHTRPQPTPPPPQQQQQPSQPPVSSPSAKSDGTSRRPEITAACEEGVRSTGMRMKEMVPVKAPSSAAMIASESVVGHQRRRVSDLAGTTSPIAQLSPRNQIPIPTATAAAAQGPPISARRPSSVRGGRNLVLLTNGTQSPVGTTAATAPQRPQIPARPPSQGSHGSRVSVSNGMVALTPLFARKRPDVSASVGRRHPIVDAKASAPHGSSMALVTTTTAGASGQVRRRVTASPNPLDTAAAAVVSLPPTMASTPHAPLMPRVSARKEDDTRATTTTESLQQRIPPQRLHSPVPST